MEKPVALEQNKYRERAPDQTPAYDAEKMIGPDNTAYILLGQQIYTLRKTSQNKLVLTK